jgi:DUF438 domain-containing protein
MKNFETSNSGLGIGSTLKSAQLKRTDGADADYKALRQIEGHPLNIFFEENNAIRDALADVREALKCRDADSSANLLSALDRARELAIHYAEKGDLLYPLLKLKYKFAGPSDAMWSVDTEIRDEMKALSNSAHEFPKLLDDEDWNARLDTVLTKAEQMISKEEQIIFPLCAKSFSDAEWKDIARDFDDYKPCLIEKRPLWEKATPKRRIAEMPGFDETLNLPTGSLTLEQLDAMLNTIPMELTFVDTDDINRYVNDGADMKLFKRPLMALGREVYSCHPPKVEPMVRSVIEQFRAGTRDAIDIWSTRDNQPVLVKYMAVRDKDGRYIGTLECVQPMGFAEKHFSKDK